MMNGTQSAIAKETRYQWPDLTKDTKAVELAKVAMGWSNLTVEQQMDATSELAQRAQQIKETL